MFSILQHKMSAKRKSIFGDASLDSSLETSMFTTPLPEQSQDGESGSVASARSSLWQSHISGDSSGGGMSTKRSSASSFGTNISIHSQNSSMLVSAHETALNGSAAKVPAQQDGGDGSSSGPGSSAVKGRDSRPSLGARVMSFVSEAEDMEESDGEDENPNHETTV